MKAAANGSAPSGGLLKSAAALGVIMLAAKLSGMVRDVVIAAAFGTSEGAIAYETASRLPSSMFDLALGGVISAAFVPVFSELLVKGERDGDKRPAFDFAGNYMAFILAAAGILTAAGIVFSPLLVNLAAPDASDGVKLLAALLCRIMFVSVIFTSLAFSLVGILQSSGHFYVPAAISLVSNAVMTGYVLLFGERFGVTGLSVAYVLGWAGQAAVQLPVLRKMNCRMRLRLDLRSPDLRRTLKGALPILAASWTAPVCTLVTTALASAIENGRAITAVGYAVRLFTLLTGLFSFVASNLLFPYLSRAAASGDADRAKRVTRDATRLLVRLILPASAGMFILARPVAELLYVRGAFTAADAALTSDALRFYAVGMAGAALGEVLSKAMLAKRLTKPPMYVAFGAAAVNIALAVVLAPRIGVAGIAVAQAVSSTLGGAANLILCVKLGLTGFGGVDAFNLVYTTCAAAVMAAAVYAVYAGPASVMGGTAALAVSVGAGIAVYAALELPYIVISK